MARGLSTWMAVNYIKDNGFIIFDNSDRWQYNFTSKFYQFSFKRINFHGWGRAGRSSGARRFFCVISILSRSLVN